MRASNIRWIKICRDIQEIEFLSDVMILKSLSEYVSTDGARLAAVLGARLSDSVNG